MLFVTLPIIRRFKIRPSNYIGFTSLLKRTIMTQPIPLVLCGKSTVMASNFMSGLNGPDYEGVFYHSTFALRA